MEKKRQYGLSQNDLKKNRRWTFDYDYIQTLEKQSLSKDSKKAKEAKEALLFLQQFNEEYYSNNIDKESPLHKTKSQVKSVYDGTNAANRDLYGIFNPSSMSNVYDEELDRENASAVAVGRDIENTLITMLDIKNSYNNMSEEQAKKLRFNALNRLTKSQLVETVYFVLSEAANVVESLSAEQQEQLSVKKIKNLLALGD